MTTSELKKLYSRFLKGHEGSLHFAAHSHHFWPDVTRDAHLEYWDDTARNSDEKWGKIFGEVIPKAQSHIARILGLSATEQIVFAPNTHELGARILSLFAGKSELKILTTTSEFHSWRRQILRLMELPNVKVEMVSPEDQATLLQKLQERPDIFFISQVFFDSGKALTEDELATLVAHCPGETVMVVDGYHSFAALPTNIGKVEGKIFFLGGGYKYAQAGEGACFLVVPKGHWRPAYTGWFAEFGDLSKPKDANVGYAQNGMAFMGATQDFSGLYRFNSAWDLFAQEGLTVPKIHEYVRGLQLKFLELLPEAFLSEHGLKPLFSPDLSWHGHFLTFEARSETQADILLKKLQNARIFIDRRGTRLRFGFGLYQDQSDVVTLCQRLGSPGILNKTTL